VATLAAAARALGLPGCNTAPFASVIADEAGRNSRAPGSGSAASPSSSVFFKSSFSSADPVHVIVADDLFEGCSGGEFFPSFFLSFSGFSRH
jgi:hypothetical protein